MKGDGVGTNPDNPEAYAQRVHKIRSSATVHFAALPCWLRGVPGVDSPSVMRDGASREAKEGRKSTRVGGGDLVGCSVAVGYRLP